MSNAELTNVFFAGARHEDREQHAVRAMTDDRVHVVLRVCVEDFINSALHTLSLNAVSYSMHDCRFVYTYSATSVAAAHVVHGRVSHLLCNLVASALRSVPSNVSAAYPHFHEWSLEVLQHYVRAAPTCEELDLFRHANEALDTWEQYNPNATTGAFMLFVMTAMRMCKPSVIQRIKTHVIIHDARQVFQRAVREYEMLVESDRDLARALRSAGVPLPCAVGWLAPTRDAEVLEGAESLSQLLN